MTRIFLCLMLLGATPSSSYAAAWTQKQGSGQFIGGLSYSHSESYFDNSSNQVATSPFMKVDLNPFFEYGVTDQLTVGFSPSFQYVQKEENARSIQQAAFVYGELFFRKQLLNWKNLVISAQPLLKIPGLYHQEQETKFGNRQMDAEIRLLAGYGFQWDVVSDVIKRPYAGQYHFISAEAAYRRHIEDESDEIRFDSTIGVRPTEDWLVIGQLFSNFSIEKEMLLTKNFENKNSGFSLLKVQGSVVKQLDKNKSLQFGVFKDVWGKNTGNGVGTIISLWYNF